MELWIKVAIFIVVLVIAYFIMRRYEIDIFVSLWESISEIEWNPTALVLTLLISAIFWLILWKTPFWATPEGPYRLLDITGVPVKTFLSIALPIVGYPLAVRALNK